MDECIGYLVNSNLLVLVAVTKITLMEQKWVQVYFHQCTHLWELVEKAPHEDFDLTDW